MKNRILLFLLLLVFSGILYGQDDELPVEIFLIDSYVTTETPHIFHVSFYTTDSVTSKIEIPGERSFTVSEELTDNHRTEIDFTGMIFDSAYVPFYVVAETKEGREVRSQKFEVNLPYKSELEARKNYDLLRVCCFGGVIFFLPSPTMVFAEGNNYLALSKEIPLFSYYTSNYTYPTHYFSAEYTYTFGDFKADHLVRAGYKLMLPVAGIEYISPGVNFFTNFDGYNGVGLEATAGLVKIYNVFTLYGRYRYNFQPEEAEWRFHEISVGLFSNFFSLNF